MSQTYDRMAHGNFIMYYHRAIMARITHSTAPRLAAAVCHISLDSPYIIIRNNHLYIPGYCITFITFCYKSITNAPKKITGILGILAQINLILDITNASKNITGIFCELP